MKQLSFPLQERDLFFEPEFVLRSGSASNRQVVHWSEMSNENLKLTLDLLYLHHSPFIGDALAEIIKRIDAGTWLDINEPPPLHADSVPFWMHIFPFSLLWHQKQRR